MFTARTVVTVAPGAGGIAASSACTADNEFAAPAGMTATSAAARPAFSDERIPSTKPAPAAAVSAPFARRVTAQKVTEDIQ